MEEEQQGGDRAAYGDKLIPKLAAQLSKEYGKGFNQASLWRMRHFFQTFPILAALRRELSWTHYRLLTQVANESTRAFYLGEAVENQWSTRQLNRQINSFYSERPLASQDKALVMKDSAKNAPPVRPEDAQTLPKTTRRLPDTGQIQSFTNTFGEDADYPINPPFFRNNNNGTGTDTATGLMWQQTDGGEMTFENATTFCENLTLAGFSDWRLPDGAGGVFTVESLET